MNNPSQFFTTGKAEYKGLHFITVKSNALQKRADITVYAPQNTEGVLPIVILLHGVYGSHWAWTMRGKAHQTAQHLIKKGAIKPMLLIMPSDGLFGDGSGYLPHQTEDYEKWIVEDVIQVVKEQFETMVSDASPIFIAGLSMGGYGAMRLGAKYPALFSAFSGLSSITHFEQIGKFVSDFEGLKKTALVQDGVLEWILKNKTKIPPFRFDCGRDDLLIDHNRDLHNQLKMNNIPHIYQEFAGGHSWEYWHKHLAKTLLFFNEKLL